MVSTHRRMIVVAGTMLGVIACASGESERDTAGSGARDPATVAASPPLPGFGADVPAGRIPGAGTAVALQGSGATPGGAATSPSAPAGGAVGPGRGASGAPSAPGTGVAAAPTPPAGTPGAAPSGATTPGTTLAAGEISAASGVFTAAQAERGREVYTNSCARCHMASAHSGGTFASTWNGKRVSDLYDLLYNTMPVDAPGSLTNQQYVDVVAYMLQLNGHPTGKSALAPDPAALRKVRIDIRSTAGLQ